MNIALDIDDTITRCPEFFSIISKALRAAGHRVYIISWREDREFAEEDLAEYGIDCDQLILPAEQEIRGVPHRDWETAAGRWKPAACRRLQIDILFGDMPQVVNAVDRQTTVFMPVDPALGKVGYARTS
jgi:hypothetical protein